jgi:hypothetical protein
MREATHENSVAAAAQGRKCNVPWQAVTQSLSAQRVGDGGHAQEVKTARSGASLAAVAQVSTWGRNVLGQANVGRPGGGEHTARRTTADGACLASVAWLTG